MHRRSLLIGALAASACAPVRLLEQHDPAADAAFLALVEQLGRELEADSSLAGEATRRSAAQQRFTALSAIDPRGLGVEARILYEAVHAGCEAEAELARDFPFGAAGAPYVVTHRAGAYRRINAASAADELRAAALAHDIDGETERINADAARGVLPPDFLITRTLDAIASVEPQAGAALGPALVRQKQALTALRPSAPATPGMSRLPDGEAYFARILQMQLGEAVNPRAAYDEARARAAALQSEASALLAAEGFAQGDVAERLRALLRDERYLYADDAFGKARAVADMNIGLEGMRARLPHAFEGYEHTPAEIRRMSAAEEARGAAGRREANAYIVDLTHIRTRPAWTLPSVVFHETLPGHLLQAHAEAAAPRLQLRYASGYSEGWAIYAEQLADDLSAYESDPRGRIGYLQWMLFRLGRIVADIGVHALGWGRERAIDEMRALQGESIAFISIEEDVDRLCAQPGLYAAQGLAALSIAKLRTRAERRGRFTLPRFHDAMLRRGPMAPPGLARAADAAFDG